MAFVGILKCCNRLDFRINFDYFVMQLRRTLHKILSHSCRSLKFGIQWDLAQLKFQTQSGHRIPFPFGSRNRYIATGMPWSSAKNNVSTSSWIYRVGTTRGLHIDDMIYTMWLLRSQRRQVRTCRSAPKYSFTLSPSTTSRSVVIGCDWPNRRKSYLTTAFGTTVIEWLVRTVLKATYLPLRKPNNPGTTLLQH